MAVANKVKWYIQVVLYNYDRTSRYDSRRIYFDRESQALDELQSLRKAYHQLTTPDSMEETTKWCRKHGFDDAFIHSIDGLYKETTERIVVPE